MLPDRNILKTAKTILKIQDRLHPLLFGEDGYMLEETRQELLKKAQLLHCQSVTDYSGHSSVRYYTGRFIGELFLFGCF